jgi:hypothetical protein
MIRNKETGWVEAEVVINGQSLTFAESMALRVAVSSYRMFLAANGTELGVNLTEGYDRQLMSIERKLFDR